MRHRLKVLRPPCDFVKILQLEASESQMTRSLGTPKIDDEAYKLKLPFFGEGEGINYINLAGFNQHSLR